MRLRNASSVRLFPNVKYTAVAAWIVLVLGVVAGPQVGRGQTTVFEESFNDKSQFSVVQGAIGQDGDDNYFILAQNASPSINKSYSGADGNILAGQDTDDPDIGSGGAAPVQVEWTGIDISGEAGLEFTGSFGEVLDGSGDIDDDDFLRVEYRIDGGAWQNLIAFQNDGTSSNTTFKEDTDFDGDGEGTDISSSDGSLVSFTKSISGTGSTLDLRFTAHVDSGDEDFAVDNIKVESSPAVQFTTSSGKVNEDEGSTALSVKILNPPSGTSVSADVVFNSGSSSASSGDVNSFGTKSVTFPSDASSGDTETVTVDLASGGGEEGSELAVFDLQNVSGGSAATGSPAQFDLTIQDAVSDHSGDVLITEVMQNPSANADSDGEYLELYNATSSSIDINGWNLEETDGSDSETIGTSVVIPARGFVVLCRSGDSGGNGGIDCDYDHSFRLSNSDDSVVLLDGGGAEVDRIEYDGGPNWPDPNGQAMVFTGTTDNNTGSNWSAAVRRERGFALDQSGDDGSPGRNGDQQTLQPSTEVTGSAGWRLLSAPMAGVDADLLAGANLVQGLSGHFPGADPNLWQWTGGSTADWSVPSPTDDLTGSGAPTGDAGGFIWYLFGTAETPNTDPPPFTLSLPGAPRTGSVTPNGLNANRTFHLLGNPFAQAFDVSGLNLSAQNFSTTVQVWDPSANSYVDVTQSAGADDLIGPYQGFFVERASGSATSLTIPASSRRADPVSLKRDEEGPPRIEFRLIGRGPSDSVLTRDEALTLYAHPEATAGWDVYDASKLTPLSGRYATAAFVGARDGEPALKAVASVPVPVGEGGVELPVTLATHDAGAVDRFTLAWPRWTGVPEGWTLTLHDTVADSTVNLRRHPDYTFALQDPAKYEVEEGASRDGLAPPRSPGALQRSVRAKADAGDPRFILSLDGGQIPVELTRFEALGTDDAVTLRWTTASETNNAGFAIEHRGPQAQRFQSLGFVDGAGTTDRTQHYRYRTRSLEAGRHTFRLRQVDVDGTETYSDTVSVVVRLGEAAQLTVAPTPVRERATATLRVRTEQEVTVSLFDALGRRVRILHEGRLESRRPHTIRVKAQGLASGLYFLRATGERFRETRRIPVVR